MHKIKIWEISLLFGVSVAMVWGVGTNHTQEELADSMLRLHIIANSDAPTDQENKLAVRDAVLNLVHEWGEQAKSVEEMENIVTANLTQLEAAGQSALRARGCNDMVTAEVTKCYFPTKKYEAFSLPAGSYTALRLKIGLGEGHNWWCVAFPVLCIGSGAERLESAAQAGFFTREQADFLSGSGDQYVLKFKSMELLGQLKEFVCH